MVKIKEIEVSQRPRERLFTLGPKLLSNQELLQVILSSGNARIDVISLSNTIINKYSSIYNLSKATYFDLLKIKGIKQGKAALLLACLELGKRINGGELNKIQYNDLDDVFYYLYAKCVGSQNERLFVLCINIKGRLIKDEELGMGSNTSIHIKPKEIGKIAINSGAYAIIVVHSHPSGISSPSKEDIIWTQNLLDVLNIIDVKLIDHLVLGDMQYYSFSQKKLKILNK